MISAGISNNRALSGARLGCSLALSSLLACFLVGNAAHAADKPAKAERPPNIIFILVDDYGWTDLSCYGSKFYETPNIDRLADQGMRFTDAYSACTVCSPTRAAVMTGKYPARLHITDWIAGIIGRTPS